MTASIVNKNYWRVRFTEYLQFDGVKDNLEHVKAKKKAEHNKTYSKVGRMIEDALQDIFTTGGISVKEQAPQYDHGFGADFIASYVKDGKNYSFFVDATSVVKDSVELFKLDGSTTKNKEEAFVYRTEQFELLLGVKRKHRSFFTYEKPVISIVIQRLVNDLDIEALPVSHSRNICSAVVALHEMLMEKEGVQARAGHYIYPNPKFYPFEYSQYKRS